MTLARKYAKRVKRDNENYAAWYPVIDGYAIGDYGAFKRGIFQRIGNVREFSVEPRAQSATSSTKLDYTSTGTTVARTSAGVEVDVFPNSPIHAKLELTFSGNEAFYLRSTRLSVIELQSVDAVAHALKGKTSEDGRMWNLGWKIVRKVYTAVDPVILASDEKNATFTLSGKADALKALELGSGSAKISVASSSQDALQIASGTGPVMLALFRVKRWGSGAGLETATVDYELDAEWPDDEDALFGDTTQS